MPTAKKKRKPVISKSSFSKPQLIVFAIVFGLLGGYVIWRSFAATPVPANIAAGDLNNDGTINITDLSILLSNYNTSNSSADCNGDGIVNILDLSTLLSHYGTSLPAAFVSSTITDGQTLSGTVTWTINTTGAVGKVEFYANNVLLNTDTTAPYTYSLNTTALANGANTVGFRIYNPDNSLAYSSPALHVTISNGTTPPPPPPPPPSGTNLIKWGSFDAGNLSEFSDTSCHPEKVAVHVGGGPNNTNWARFSADDSVHCYPNDTNVRVHMLNFKGGIPTWYNLGHEVWRAISIRIPSSGNTNTFEHVLDEIHGDNGTGPADNTPVAKVGGQWRFVVRGGTRTDGNYDWQQVFGTNYGQALIPGIQGQQDWVGGNHNVVGDEWVHFRYGMLLKTDKTGWFEAYARWNNSTSWVHIVPRFNTPTSYPDKFGDGFAVYPIMSLYYASGGGGTSSVDYADGAWSDNFTTLSNWQNSRLGF